MHNQFPQKSSSASFPAAQSSHLIFLLLAGLMLLTRFHHFGIDVHLPDASLAVFFLAGFYLKGWARFVILLLEAALIDYVAIKYFSVSDYCVSAAYGFLAPTYASVFLAGAWLQKNLQHSWQGAWQLVCAMAISVTIAFAISNGSFYAFSGRFTDMVFAEYVVRTVQYYPPYVSAFVLYLLPVALLQAYLLSRKTSLA